MNRKAYIYKIVTHKWISVLPGAAPFDAASAYAQLAHLPSAFSMLGGHPLFPGPLPFGGLGALGDPLRSPSGLGSSLSPTAGTVGGFLQGWATEWPCTYIADCIYYQSLLK